VAAAGVRVDFIDADFRFTGINDESAAGADALGAKKPRMQIAPEEIESVTNHAPFVLKPGHALWRRLPNRYRI